MNLSCEVDIPVFLLKSISVSLIKPFHTVGVLHLDQILKTNANEKN